MLSYVFISCIDVMDVVLLLWMLSYFVMLLSFVV